MVDRVVHLVLRGNLGLDWGKAACLDPCHLVVKPNCLLSFFFFFFNVLVRIDPKSLVNVSRSDVLAVCSDKR